MKRRRSQPKAIGGVVGQVLGELGLDGAVAVMRIGELWEEAVGPDVARHCQPIGMRGDVLEVEVDSSVWCQELQLQSPRLVAALAAVLGEDGPSELRFRVGYNRSRSGLGGRN